jgi:flagellar basal-body rod protein FlgC
MTIRSLRISSSALSAERLRLDTISQNIANAQTTRGPDGEAYRRREVVFRSATSDQPGAGGVRVDEVLESEAPLERIFNPSHPDADPEGYVEMPNVNVVEEMVDLIAATRAYEANVAAANATRAMISRALELGRG